MIANVFQYNPLVIFEVGVGSADVVRSLRAWTDRAAQFHLFEPNQRNYESLVSRFPRVPNVHFHNVALSDCAGQSEFVVDGDSSFLAGTFSPAMFNGGDQYVSTLSRCTVQVDPIAKYDRGNIDLLLLDVEGHEWPIIRGMISRPKVIVFESHSENGYRNAHLDEINAWMEENSYDVVTTDVTDTMCVRRDDPLSRTVQARRWLARFKARRQKCVWEHVGYHDAEYSLLGFRPGEPIYVNDEEQQAYVHGALGKRWISYRAWKREHKIVRDTL